MSGGDFQVINQENNPVGWAMLITELDEAREHLEALVDQMSDAGAIDEYAEFAVDLGHVYAHLNRAWHSRNQEEGIGDEQWAPYSQFPKDLKPIG